jgi:hypothetical protein
MYTKELNYDKDENPVWDILDPDGDRICTIEFEDQADALLSHLNRNS